MNGFLPVCTVPCSTCSKGILRLQANSAPTRLIGKKRVCVTTTSYSERPFKKLQTPNLGTGNVPPSKSHEGTLYTVMPETDSFSFVPGRSEVTISTVTPRLTRREHTSSTYFSTPPLC